MIKKFNDFINEGLWSKTFSRAKTGTLRNEDEAFFNQDDIFEVHDVDGYYIIDKKEENMTYIYHYPKMTHVCKFYNIEPKYNGYIWDELKFSKDVSDEEKNFIKSDEFKKKIYDTIQFLIKKGIVGG